MDLGGQSVRIRYTHWPGYRDAKVAKARPLNHGNTHGLSILLTAKK
jgi:hypothetical protein